MFITSFENSTSRPPGNFLTGLLDKNGTLSSPMRPKKGLGLDLTLR